MINQSIFAISYRNQIQNISINQTLDFNKSSKSIIDKQDCNTKNSKKIGLNSNQHNTNINNSIIVNHIECTNTKNSNICTDLICNM